MILTIMISNIDILPGMSWENVSGWGLVNKSKSLVYYAKTLDDCIKVIQFAKANGLSLLSSGKGYTFGDMIINHQNIIVKTTKMDKIISWDKNTGNIIVEPGVMVADVLMKSLPYNWVLCSIPGGLEVTIGGAVSNNIHGKDSWKVGNFGDRVVSLKMVTASGEILSINKIENKQLFNAVIGGMGLFGIIIEITLQLQKVPSAYVEQKIIPTSNVQESIDLLEDAKNHADFSIAWVDAFSKGSKLGRGYVSMAKWVDEDIEIDQSRLVKSLTLSKKLFDMLPAKPSWALFRPFYKPSNMKFVNALIFTLNGMKYNSNSSYGNKLLFSEYNFMHNKIPDFNYVYYPYGFLEIEFLFPVKYGYKPIAECLTICQHLNCESMISAIKVHKKDNFYISFSSDGYSFTIDIPLRGRKINEVYKSMNEILNHSMKYDALVYLAKDEYLPKMIFNKMYPRYKEFLIIKNRIDPSGLFQSDMYRRLLQD